jgi:hypothetical protein
MKKILFLFLAVVMSLVSLPAFSQAKEQPKEDTTALLGLPGDNLDLYAVLSLFQKSKTIEAFEKSLNDEKEKINNLDLNLDKKIDFIKVTTTREDSSYRFVLQVDVTKTETQDVAVIYLNKDKGKISLQIVGDEELYGKDYVVEPKGNSPVTPNPAYTGENPVTVTVPASTTTVVVQSAPIVQYVYSPAYVPYYPPYYYGYYPPWFGFATVMAVGIYRSNNWGYHGGYYGGHYHGGNNNVIINNGNRNQINHYNNSRNTSNTVSNNMAKGNYGNGNRGNNTGNRGGAGVNNNMANSNRGSSAGAGVNNNMANNNRGSSSAGVSNNKAGSNRSSSSSRPSSGNYSSSSRSNYSSSSRSSSSMSAGGGRSMGSSRSMGGGGGRRR